MFEVGGLLKVAGLLLGLAEFGGVHVLGAGCEGFLELLLGTAALGAGLHQLVVQVADLLLQAGELFRARLVAGLAGGNDRFGGSGAGKLGVQLLDLIFEIEHAEGDELGLPRFVSGLELLQLVKGD